MSAPVGVGEELPVPPTLDPDREAGGDFETAFAVNKDNETVEVIYIMASYQMAPNGTEQWHPTTWHPAKAPYHSTQQMHRTMAPSNGTLPWHPAMTP